MKTFFRCGHRIIDPVERAIKKYSIKRKEYYIYNSVECRICHNLRGKFWGRDNVKRKSKKRWSKLENEI